MKDCINLIDIHATAYTASYLVRPTCALMGNKKRTYDRKGAKFGIAGETVTRESSRHEGSQKTLEEKARRTKEWRETPQAKIRVGPKAKPFLGTRTTKLKCWPKHQREIFDIMRSQPEDSEIHWQDPAQFYGIIYRFWFLHSHKFFANRIQMMLAIREVWRAVKSGIIKTTFTLNEARMACYALRGNYMRLKDLIKLTGPALVPVAKVITASPFAGLDDVEELAHRVPVAEIPKKMAASWARFERKNREEPWLIHIESQLNGSHGEVTEDDDLDYVCCVARFIRNCLTCCMDNNAVTDFDGVHPDGEPHIHNHVTVNVSLDPHFQSALNGSHGEATNSDDVVTRRQQRIMSYWRSLLLTQLSPERFGNDMATYNVRLSLTSVEGIYVVVAEMSVFFGTFRIPSRPVLTYVNKCVGRSRDSVGKASAIACWCVLQEHIDDEGESYFRVSRTVAETGLFEGHTTIDKRFFYSCGVDITRWTGRPIPNALIARANAEQNDNQERMDVRSDLNGANGEVTGSDDVTFFPKGSNPFVLAKEVLMAVCCCDDSTDAENDDYYVVNGIGEDYESDEDEYSIDSQLDELRNIDVSPNHRQVRIVDLFRSRCHKFMLASKLSPSKEPDCSHLTISEVGFGDHVFLDGRVSAAASSDQLTKKKKKKRKKKKGRKVGITSGELGDKTEVYIISEDDVPPLIPDSDSDDDEPPLGRKVDKPVPLILRGGAGPFLAAAVKNQGQGGNSKVSRPAEAPPEGVEHAKSVDNRLSEDQDSEGEDQEEFEDEDDARKAQKKQMKWLERKFTYNPHPGIRTKFRDPNKATVVQFDQGGAPFCGRVAIDVAAGFKPDVKEYLKSLDGDEVFDVPRHMGALHHVGEYGFSRGVNVVILVEGQQPYVFNNRYTHWVVLKLLLPHEMKPDPSVPEPEQEGEGEQKGECEAPPKTDRAGHYVIMTAAVSDEADFEAVDGPGVVRRSWLTGKLFELTTEARLERLYSTFESVYDRVELGAVTSVLTTMGTLSKLSSAPGLFFINGPALLGFVVIGGVCYFAYRAFRLSLTNVYKEETVFFRAKYELESNEDVRCLTARRDAVEYQDRFTDCVVMSSYHFDYGLGTIKLFDCPTKEHVVSDTLYKNGLHAVEMAASVGTDPSKGIVEIGRQRTVNYPAGENVLSGTSEVLMIASAKVSKGLPVGPRLRGMVPVAAPPAAANIPNVDVAIENQQVANLLKVVGAGMAPDCPNYVNKFRVEADPDKQKVPVGVYPIGTLYSDEPVGPGFYAVTDSMSTLTAFVGRGMTKSMREDNTVVIDFIKQSKEFLNYYIDSVDVNSISRKTAVQQFAEHYRGKRSAAWIDNKIAEYHRYCSGIMTRKERRKYDRHGFFVKFERNEKGGLPRPRGIMTMSGRMLIECCPILSVIEAWNHSEFSRFQVKGMTPEEQFKRIMEHTNEAFSVSDYSSYESSIDEMIREIEEYVIKCLLVKVGMTHVWECYLEHAGGKRILHTRWGEFVIGTRCSGDFWTSFGNGIINVCAMRYCALKKGLPFYKMLAEGDDGLLPTKIPDEAILASLGFKFSSEQRGTQDGDCDFLRKRVVDGKYYLPIGKVLTSILFVKKGHILKKSKQMNILRCMAHSVYHQSPGHPVLTAMVNRIWEETRAYVSPVRGEWLKSHFNEYVDVDISDPGLKRVEVDESMRSVVAEGGHGFPPMPVAIQIELERRFEKDETFFVGHLLDDDDDFASCVTSTILDSPNRRVLTAGQILNFIADSEGKVTMTDKVKRQLDKECVEFTTFPYCHL